jgi:ribosome-binding protein aMBF1 (putative translation factor)
MMRGWSQEALGVCLKCDERSVRDWESGKPPSPSQAAAVEARLPEIDVELRPSKSSSDDMVIQEN